MQSLCGGTEAIMHRRAGLARMCAKPIPCDRRQTAARASHATAHGTMPSQSRTLW